MTVLIGDEVKQSKEVRKMPGVKRLHQESENSSKAKYIFGHMFGAVGVLIGDISRMFCVPLSMKIHDGIESIRQWNESDKNTGSHIVQMIENSFGAAKIMRKSLYIFYRCQHSKDFQNLINVQLTCSILLQKLKCLL